jgi:hypothetical protein
LALLRVMTSWSHPCHFWSELAFFEAAMYKQPKRDSVYLRDHPSFAAGLIFQVFSLCAAERAPRQVPSCPLALWLPRGYSPFVTGVFWTWGWLFLSIHFPLRLLYNWGGWVRWGEGPRGSALLFNINGQSRDHQSCLPIYRHASSKIQEPDLSQLTRPHSYRTQFHLSVGVALRKVFVTH